MFTVLLALIEGKYKIEFSDLYIGTVLLDSILLTSISEIILSLVTK